MKRSIHLAVAVPLLVLGAYAVAQTGARPPKPPTVVKPAGVGAPNAKIMSTPSSGAAKANVNGGVQKAQGAGSLAPPPPGNAAIKGESAAIKGGSAGAIGGSGAIKGESAAIKGGSSGKFSDESPKERAAAKVNKSSGGAVKQATGGDDGGGDGGLRAGAAMKGNSAITGSGAIKGNSAINGGTMKAEKASGALKGAPAGALNSPRDPAMR